MESCRREWTQCKGEITHTGDIETTVMYALGKPRRAFNVTFVLRPRSALLPGNGAIANPFRRRRQRYCRVITGDAYLSIESRENSPSKRKCRPECGAFTRYRGNSISTMSLALEFISRPRETLSSAFIGQPFRGKLRCARETALFGGALYADPHCATQ